jgi:glucan biosynthesis protein C
MTENTHGGRLHALDALRGHMMLLGVVLHAGLCYGAGPVDAVWPLRDAAASTPLAVLVSLITTFRMPAFFLVAGFFFQMLIDRRGLASAARDRFFRVIPPLILFLPLAIFFCGSAFHWSITRLPSDNPARLNFSWFQLYHLWFLYFLSMYYLMFGAIAYVFSRMGLSFAFLRNLPLWAAPLLWGVLLGILAQTSVPFKLDASVGLIPNPVRLAFFALFFSFGQWLYLKKHDLHKLPGFVWLFLALSIVALVAGVVSISLFSHTHETLSFLETSLLGAALFLLCMFIVSAYLRWGGTASAGKLYLAKASFWIYLVHLPLVLWFFVFLDQFSINIYLKFVLNIVATTFVCLVSYRLFVKETWIGLLLEGRLRFASSKEDKKRGV